MLVPDGWIKNNLLYWPKHLLRWEVERLRADPCSCPEETTFCSKLIFFKRAYKYGIAHHTITTMCYKIISCDYTVF